MYMHINESIHRCIFYMHMWVFLLSMTSHVDADKIFDSWNVLPKNMYFTLIKLVVKKGILHTIFVYNIWYSFYLFPFKILPFWHFIYVFFFLLYMGISRTLYTIVSCKLELYCAYQDNWFPMYKLICICVIYTSCTCIKCWETCIFHCLPWEIGYYQHAMYFNSTQLGDLKIICNGHHILIFN